MSGGAVASLPEGLLDGGVWFRVEAAATASAVRRTADRLAVQLNLPERRAADMAADEVIRVAETVVVRPDPVAATA